MLVNIISHTPLYVWAILAFLISRGVAAMRERELPFKSLLIIPAVMLVLSLSDIANKFGLGALPLAAWLAGAAASGVLAWRGSAARISMGSAPGLVRVRGSAWPLVLMLAIFVTKYATAVSLAIAPGVAGQALFIVGICLLFGAFNGFFLGRLARDAATFAGPSSLPANA